MESRRAFLGRCGAGAAAWTALGAGGWESARAGVLAAAFDPDRLAELSAFAMERARAAGAVVRRHPDQPLSRPVASAFAVQADRATGKPVEVPSVSDDGSFGFGLRVLADGAWGFSASYEVTRDAIARAATEAVEIARANAPLRRRPIELAPTPSYQDTYRTKIAIDPFSVPIEQKLELLRSAAARAREVAGVFIGHGPDRRSAGGSLLRLDRRERHRAARLPDRPEFTATAVEAGRKVKSRTYRPHSVCRRLRGRRAGRHVLPRPPGRRGGRRAPEGALGLRRASKTWSSCRPTSP